MKGRKFHFVGRARIEEGAHWDGTIMGGGGAKASSVNGARARAGTGEAEGTRGKGNTACTLEGGGGRAAGQGSLVRMSAGDRVPERR